MQSLVSVHYMLAKTGYIILLHSVLNFLIRSPTLQDAHCRHQAEQTLHKIHISHNNLKDDGYQASTIWIEVCELEFLENQTYQNGFLQMFTICEHRWGNDPLFLDQVVNPN